MLKIKLFSCRFSDFNNIPFRKNIYIGNKLFFVIYKNIQSLSMFKP